MKLNEIFNMKRKKKAIKISVKKDREAAAAVTNDATKMPPPTRNEKELLKK